MGWMAVALGSKSSLSPVRTRRYSLTVHGEHRTWAFDVEAIPEHVEEWRADGLVVDEVMNVIPQWVVEAGLTRVWVFVEDLLYFRFRNPFR